jgi:thiosulfate dehydrogenase [quinone] large subunit
MTLLQKITLLLVRLGLGWLFFYSGLTKLMDPNWTASGYLNDAKVFPNFFQLFNQPESLVYLDFVCQWLLIVLGVLLIIGLFSSASCLVGAVILFFYYLMTLSFTVVDEKVIAMLVLLALSTLKIGNIWGVDYLILKYIKK